MRGISFSAGEEHLIRFPSTKPFISARSSKVQLTPAESSGTLWASNTNCIEGKGENMFQSPVHRTEIRYTINHNEMRSWKWWVDSKKKCRKDLIQFHIYNRTENTLKIIDKFAILLLQLWSKIKQLSSVPNTTALKHLWTLPIGFGANMFLKYDSNTILLMRSTAAASAQSKDPSAGRSVARGATGGLLNKRFSNQNPPAADIQTTLKHYDADRHRLTHLNSL